MSYCTIAAGHPLHGPYHDMEYGFPVGSDDLLFERLVLEINQAGLSWLTILKKREAFRSAFQRFEIDRVDAEREPYLVGDVHYLDEDPGTGTAAETLADRAADAYGQYLTGILATSTDAHTDLPLGELREGSPSDVSYRIAGGLGIDAAERQRLLETEATGARLASVLRLIERENTLLKELIVRLRARGEGPTLN